MEKDKLIEIINNTAKVIHSEYCKNDPDYEYIEKMEKFLDSLYNELDSIKQ